MHRILFVDDDVNVLTGLRRSLRSFRSEWEMVFVDGGAAALRACESGPFDVIVSDERMPGMEGDELLAEVRRLYPDTVRIVLSGQCSRNSLLKCVGVAHQFLSKPCDTAALCATIRKVCSRRSQFPDVAVRERLARVQWLPSDRRFREKLAALLRLSDVPIEAVTRFIARDVAAAAKALQLVSSGFFGTPRRVTSAAEAFLLLGTETVEALWECREVSGAECAPGREGKLRRLERHSRAVAKAARQIAATLIDDPIAVGDAYLAGMLHEIGVVAACLADGEETPQAAPTVQASTPPVGLAGNNIGPDAGAYLAALWGFPDPIVQAIAFYRQPDVCAMAAQVPLAALRAAHERMEAEEADSAEHGSLCALSSPWELTERRCTPRACDVVQHERIVP